MRFCPGCGKGIEHGTFCEECMPRKEVSIKDISIKVCTLCDKYNSKGSWVEYTDLSEPIGRAVLTAVRKKIADPEVSVDLPELVKKPGTEQIAEVQVESEEGVYEIPVTINYTYCSSCAKRSSTYFEGTFQLRTDNKEIIDYVHHALGTNLVEKEREKGGIDIKVQDKKKMNSMADYLLRRFGGTLKKSPELHTRDPQTSKDLYRLNIYYEPFKFVKDDIILADGKVVKVAKIGKTVNGFDLEKRQSVSLLIKEGDYQRLDKKTTTVSKAFPHVEVLHPETFQSTHVANSIHGLKMGEKVKVVEAHDKLFLA